MPKLVAFLRAINVGGHTVSMAALREAFGAVGLEDVESFIASGNVIFTAPPGGAAGIERKIEDHLQELLGYEVKTFVRTQAEVAAIAAYQPFSAARVRAAATLNVAFLAEPLPPAAVKVLTALRTPIDDFHVNGREMYWLCQARQSDSTFSNVRFEKAVGQKTTFRGFKTIAKLAAKYSWTHEAP